MTSDREPNPCYCRPTDPASPTGYCSWQELVDCPEWCDHGGRCAKQRAALAVAERRADEAWVHAAELAEPGYDYDPNDPEARDR